MKYIKEKNLWLKDRLIDQPVTSQKYRMSNFVVKLPIDDGILLYNTATGCMIFLEGELDMQLAKDQLISNWFYVPATNFDESLWVDFLRDKRRELLALRPNKSYIIMTTMDCNARCFYCYEKGRKPIVMTDHTANDLFHFIVKTSGNNKTKLTWFGGEPLVNWKVIDTICTRLKEEGVEYISNVISNGLLFTDEMIQKACSLWHLRMVQITLDGTEQVYLKTKAYKQGHGDEFTRVTNNIENLLKHHISVSIRLNQNLTNTEDLSNLVDFLKGRFSQYTKFSVYNRLLFGEEETNESQEAYFQLKHKLMELGLYKPKFGEAIRSNRCMADNANSYVITPDGHLGKCEHYSEDHFIGTLCGQEFDYGMIAQFKETYETIPFCKSCPQYPSCIRLKKCPSEPNVCSQVWRKDWLDNIHYLMVETYNKSKKNAR